MFNGDIYREELKDRIRSITRLLDATHPDGVEDAPAAREARGLTILLLFAAYENLLYSLCRGILEEAKRISSTNSALPDHFKVFAIYDNIKSITEISAKKEEVSRWKKTCDLVELISSDTTCSINTDVFPIDGSYMKRTQIYLVFNQFKLGNPAEVLEKVWGRIDTIVDQRNAIAHGRKTPEEVGRGYSINDVRVLVKLWESYWLKVVDHIERIATESYFGRSS